MLEKTRRRPACGVVALVLVSVRFVGGCLRFLACRLRLLRVLLRLFNVGCWLPEPPVLGLRHLLVQRTGFGVDCRRFLLVLFRGLGLCPGRLLAGGLSTRVGRAFLRRSDLGRRPGIRGCAVRRCPWPTVGVPRATVLWTGMRRMCVRWGWPVTPRGRVWLWMGRSRW